MRYRDFIGWAHAVVLSEESLDTLLTGRRIGRMHVGSYVRDGDRVFETYWTTSAALRRWATAAR
jgi:hypothetical protein